MPRRIVKPTTADLLERLTPDERETWGRVIYARRKNEAGMPMKQAAREAGTTPRTMKRWLGDGLQKSGGRWTINPDAEQFVYVKVPTTSGARTLPANRAEADLVREYRQEVWHVGGAKDPAELARREAQLRRKFEGRTVAGYELETDIAEINEQIDSGAITTREIGSGVTGQ